MVRVTLLARRSGGVLSMASGYTFEFIAWCLGIHCASSIESLLVCRRRAMQTKIIFETMTMTGSMFGTPAIDTKMPCHINGWSCMAAIA